MCHLLSNEICLFINICLLVHTNEVNVKNLLKGMFTRVIEMQISNKKDKNTQICFYMFIVQIYPVQYLQNEINFRIK